ncbi:MAG: SEC-C domain-containing protein, partial [Acidobacteria bacterium]|nr:SEC-C domain-containing protein [Acidobacteriota bacterium]
PWEGCGPGGRAGSAPREGVSGSAGPAQPEFSGSGVVAAAAAPAGLAPQQQLSRPARPLAVEEEPGRNDPCPCGSGKKYKKCHLQHDVIQVRREAMGLRPFR